MTSAFITLFFNMSGGEILIILLVVFIVFGPSKIPELARSLGRVMNEVKKASGDLSREFRKEATAIERDLRKTADDLTKEIDPLRETYNPHIAKRVHESEAQEIPDVYNTRHDDHNTAKSEPIANQGKTENPIQ